MGKPKKPPRRYAGYLRRTLGSPEVEEVLSVFSGSLQVCPRCQASVRDWLIQASRNGGINAVRDVLFGVTRDCPICRVFEFEPAQSGPFKYRQTIDPSVWAQPAYRAAATRQALSLRIVPKYCLSAKYRQQNPCAYSPSRAMKRLVYAGHRECEKCHRGQNLSIDHIVPFHQGGRTLPANLQVLCRTCNQRKGSELPVIVDGCVNGRNMFLAVISVVVWNTTHRAWSA